MEITNVKVKKIKDERGSLLAVCSVLIDNSLLIKNIKLIRIKDKKIIAMPNKNKNGKYEDICNPINQETRDMFFKAIMKEYSKTY